MTEDSTDPRDQLAAAFDRDRDPLADHEATFETIDIDPFELFVEHVLDSKDITPRTRKGYDRLIGQWRAHMADQGRHPACPAVTHLRTFAERERYQKQNHPETIWEKLRKLEEVFRYWQAEPSLPHTSDYDPFDVLKRTLSFDAPETKPLPQIPLEDLREFLTRIDRLRDLAIILLQLKLGLRATEVCNLVIGEIDLDNAELSRHYPKLGGHWMLDERPNAVHIPHDRYGNKSGRPRVLPLDTEVRDVLRRYLFIRPTIEAPWIFLSDKDNQLNQNAIGDIWKDVFHPEYAESEHHRSVVSHYGRHRFTTYWRVDQDLSRPLLKYLRGDRPGSESIADRDGIDSYIHTYYEDIEQRYREDIYQLL